MTLCQQGSALAPPQTKKDKHLQVMDEWMVICKESFIIGKTLNKFFLQENYEVCLSVKKFCQRICDTNMQVAGTEV